MVDDNANRVTLRWYRWGADLVDAARLAEDRCVSRSRYAELLNVSTDEDVGSADFACR